MTSHLDRESADGTCLTLFGHNPLRRSRPVICLSGDYRRIYVEPSRERIVKHNIFEIARFVDGTRNLRVPYSNENADFGRKRRTENYRQIRLVEDERDDYSLSGTFLDAVVQSVM